MQTSEKDLRAKGGAVLDGGRHSGARTFTGASSHVGKRKRWIGAKHDINGGFLVHSCILIGTFFRGPLSLIQPGLAFRHFVLTLTDGTVGTLESWDNIDVDFEAAKIRQVLR